MKSLDRSRRLLALGLVVAVALLGFQMTNTAAAHAAPIPAAGTQPAASTSVGPTKGSAASYHPTPTQRAYAADKSRLADEYAHQVLTGREPLAVYESHYRAFMIKWHLGNVANLHAALTRGTARLRANAPNLSPNCISVATGPNVLCVVYQVQFPEVENNWCGPSTLATTAIENSFAWQGANTYGSETLYRNPYVVSQPNGTNSGYPAWDDEHWLAANGVIEPDPNNPNWLYVDGTSADRMNTMINNFTNGHGGNYVQEWLPVSWPISQQIADYQPKVEGDIGTGWDVPDGIDIYPGDYYTMPGYPKQHGRISHYVAVTYISSDGNTVYYSDPIYGNSYYQSPPPPQGQGFNVAPPYESTDITNMVTWTSFILW